MKRTIASSAALLALALSAAAAAERAWAEDANPFAASLARRGFEAIATSRNVQVYQKQHTEAIQFAAVGTFEAPPAKVRQVLLDYDAQLGHVGRLSEVKVLERGPSSAVVYQRLNLPIVADRDYVLDVNWGARGDQLWILHKAIAGRGPAPRDGVVRVTDHVGRWLLKPAQGGAATVACFETRIDMSGSIPRFMVRSGTAKELPDVFSEFASLISSSSTAAQ